MGVKKESEKVGLKLNIQKLRSSSPITSWKIDGETVADLIFLGSIITADGDCNHEIKRCLLLGRKVMTNLDSILRIRDITLPTKVHLIKTMVFPVVMCGCEWKWKWSRSVMFDFATPWTGAHQASLSMGFSRQEYWSGLPVSSPGDLPDPGLNPGLPQCRQMLWATRELD